MGICAIFDLSIENSIRYSWSSFPRSLLEQKEQKDWLYVWEDSRLGKQALLSNSILLAKLLSRRSDKDAKLKYVAY